MTAPENKKMNKENPSSKDKHTLIKTSIDNYKKKIKINKK